MLNSLFAILAGIRSRGSRRSAALRSRRLTLEVLEDRTLPAVRLFPHHLPRPRSDDGLSHGDHPDITAPVITTASLPAATAGAVYGATVTATGSPAPTFSEVSGPAGLTVNATTGAIAWTPTAAQLGTQTVTIKASNAAAAVTASFAITVAKDTTPPTAPGLAVAATTTTSLTLSWTGATDNVGVAGYRLYNYTPAVYKGHSGRGGGITLVSPAKYTLLAGNIASTQYTVTGLAPGIFYSYVVAAFDAAGNQSAYSAPLTAETWLPPSLTWFTNGVNAAPVISVVANQSLYMTLFGAGNPAPTLSLVSAPSGVVFTPGQFTNSQLTTVIPNITWTPTALQVGINYITMRETSAAGTTDTVIPMTVVPDVPIPSVNINGGITYTVGNMTLDPNSPFTYHLTVNAAFNNTGSSPQYAISSSPFVFQVTGTSRTSPTTYALASGPAGMTIDPITGAGTWTPAKSDAGNTSVAVRATNSAGTSYLTFSFPTYFTDAPANVAVGFYTSAPSTNTAPAVLTPVVTWTAPADSTGVADYKITVTNANTRDVTTYDTHGTGVSFALTSVPSGQNWIDVTAYDANGNPSVTSASNVPLYLGALPGIGWTFSMPNAVVGQPFSAQFTKFNGSVPYAIVSGPAGVTINSTTGSLSWTPTLADVGTANVVVSATTAWGTEYLTVSIVVSLT